jgi:peptidyl-prolyl cis-trans isomerase A (cyclophilin A)
MIGRVALALMWLLALPALAQEAPPSLSQPTTPPPAATVKVALLTSEGTIVLALEKDRAPITAANFLRYVDQKRLDNTTFYRAVKVEANYGFIQGGLRNDPKRILKPIPHEPTTKTGLTHSEGTISMARAAPGTATMDFFITVGDMKPMDADPSQPGDNLGFAAFGHVIEGMDVVHKILDQPTSPTEGLGPMKGQMLAAPVKILSAKRVS